MPVSLLRAPVLAARHAFDDLAERQTYVVRRDQLADCRRDRAPDPRPAVCRSLGHIRAARDHSAQRAVDTGLQRRWATLLNAGPGAALCARTALELDGLRGWGDDRSMSSFVMGLAAPRCLASRCTSRAATSRGATCIPPPCRRARGPRDPPSTRRRGAAIHESPVAYSQLSSSSGSPLPDRLRKSCSCRPGAFATRSCSVEPSRTSLAEAPRLSEIDFVRLCRRHGLPEPSTTTSPARLLWPAPVPRRRIPRA